MTSHTQHPGGTATAARTPVQLAALVVGVAFLPVGVLGFVPGITTDYDSLSFASHDSGAMLLGVGMVLLGVALGRRVGTNRVEGV